MTWGLLKRDVNFASVVLVCFLWTVSAMAQTPTPTPPANYPIIVTSKDETNVTPPIANNPGAGDKAVYWTVCDAITDGVGEQCRHRDRAKEPADQRI